MDNYNYSIKAKVFICAALAAILVTVFLVLDKESALSFIYGGSIVFLGKTSIWWINRRTIILERRHSLSERHQLARVIWAQFANYVIIIALFIYAWNNQILIQHPFDIIVGYLITTVLIILLSQQLSKKKLKESTIV